MAKKNYVIQVLNQSINLFWTLIAFAPVLWFWIITGLNYWFYIILVIAVLFSVLPQKVLQQLTIGNNQTVYEKWGVKFIRKFVQDGDWIKSWSNGSLPLRIGNKFQARRYLTTIAMYERFHWTCFMFFAGTAVYAIIIGHVWISLWITVTNIAYNVTSIMLQQYNRLRINRLYKIIG